MNIHVNCETIVILCNWLDGMNSAKNIYIRKRRGASAPSPDRRLHKFLQSDH